MKQRAGMERCIEFIAAAIQVPSFLIVRKGDFALADPRYDKLLHDWLDTAMSAAPSPGMDEFAFALASGLSAHIYGDEQLAMTMAGRGYRTRSWVSSLRIGTMLSWMQTTPINQIARLAACWRGLLDADADIDRAASSTRQKGADRRAALAWHLIQTSVDGDSFRSGHVGALALLSTTAVVDGWCGHRSP